MRLKYRLRASVLKYLIGLEIKNIEPWGYEAIQYFINFQYRFNERFFR